MTSKRTTSARPAAPLHRLSRRAVLSLAAAGAVAASLGLPGPAYAGDAEAARVYIDRVAGRLLRLVSSDQPLSAKRDAFKTMIEAEGAVEDIARAALGAPWKRMSANQKSAYTEAFISFLAQTYAEQFDNYAGETFKVVSARNGRRKTIYVATQVARPNGGQKLNVEWRVRDNGSGFKVLDVVVEGVSLVFQQRSELAALLAQSGNDIDAFILALSTRV